MEKVHALQALMLNFLKKNYDKVIFSQKKQYRTTTITGGELLKKVWRVAALLKQQQISKGDNIIILSSNYLEWIAVYYASIFSGVIVVPLDILTDKGLLQRIQHQVKAKAIFQDKGLASLRMKTYYLDELDEILKSIAPIQHIMKVKPDDLMEIMYTSGTTGEPKGVILTYENIHSGLLLAVKSVPLPLKLRILTLLPLSHIFGQVFGLFFSMYFSYHTFFIDTLKPRKIISFIKNKRIHGILAVPGTLTTLQRELEGKSTLRNLGYQFRFIGVGGASLDRELEQWWKQRLINIVQGYGLTETSSIISTNKFFPTKTGSVGKIASGVEVKLGEDHEILVKGKQVTQGYYQDKEKTKASFEQEWFKTGDIGEIRGNYLYIKGRKKDVIITGSGLKAYAVDIEHVLNTLDGVKESCVIEKDKKIHAILLLNKKVNASEIIKKANAKLLSHQKIASFSLWSKADFPKTPTGKIKKYLVQQQEVSTGKEYQYEDTLSTIIHAILKPHQKITSQKKLAELGMDSLKRVELVSELEKVFDIEVEEEALTQYTKVADLEKLMKEHRIQRISFQSWPLSFISRIMRFLGQRILVFPFISIFTTTEYRGLEHLKLKGPCIFASDHQSAWDGPLVIRKLNSNIAIPASPEVVFGINSGMLRKFKGVLASLFFNTYPFGAAIGTDASLEFTGEMIDRGFSILIFPEGERTPDGEIKTFKSGIGYLALHMNVPIFPVKIDGLYDILPGNKLVPKFGKTVVKFGKPLFIKNMSYQEATTLIEKAVRRL